MTRNMAYTYDLVKLHAQVRDMLPPRARFCITFEIWDGGALGLEAEVRLYHDGNHYVGDTPDQALDALYALPGPGSTGDARS